MPVPVVPLVASAPVLPLITPPEFVVPLPVMVKFPLPVPLREMPLPAPAPELMLRNVTPLPPIVVPEMFNPLPDVVVMVLTIVVLFCVMFTVPPPVAVKAALAPVLRLRAPVKLIVAPVFEARLMPRLSVMAPLNRTVPPVWLVISTERPVAELPVVLIVPRGC